MTDTNTRPWKLCCLIAIILAALTFTPIITPAGRFTPMLFGMPYTLWTGILLAIALVTLTFIGTRVHPAKKKGDER